MSNYGHETATITFTKTGYLQFVRAFRKTHNAKMAVILEHALALHARLASIKGPGATQARQDAFNETLKHGGFIIGHQRLLSGTIPKIQALGSELLSQLRFEMFRGKDGALTKPRKSAFRHLSNRDLAFSLSCNAQGTLQFSPNQINWASTRGNSTWVYAKSSLGYSAFQATLDAYDWKRGEGGWFICHDEISQADYGEPLRQQVGRP